jgi:sugar phosphate isomerase/epimerase
MTAFSVPTLLWRNLQPDGSVISPYSLEQLADAVADAGFAQIGVDDLTVAGRDPEDVARVLRDRGLACSDVGILFLCRSRSRDDARRLAELAAATGALACIAVPGKPYEQGQLVEELHECGEILRAAGVRLALEFVPYVHLKTLGETIELCEAVGWERSRRHAPLPSQRCPLGDLPHDARRPDRAAPRRRRRPHARRSRRRES